MNVQCRTCRAFKFTPIDLFMRKHKVGASEVCKVANNEFGRFVHSIGVNLPTVVI
jgi:hypothetical protein